ncbi:hypothetical protein [Streptomyces sp. NPDC002676]
MPLIVGIHGMAQQFSSSYELESSWFNALRGGLDVAGWDIVAEALADKDLRVAFFADLFRPTGAMPVGEPAYGPDDIRPGLDRDLLTVLYGAALEREPDLAPPEGAMRLDRAATAFMLRQLLRSRTFAGVAERAFIGNLRQVSDYLTDPATKGAVLRRLGKRVGNDTRVLIGHSLGSVIAYEYLYRSRPASIRLLLTLGSPLGMPHLIFDRLSPAPVNGLGPWPGDVPTWVNVADHDDIVALRPELAGLFPGPPPDGQVDDRRVINDPAHPHAATNYLNARETGSALGHVLGQGVPGEQPQT